MKQKCLFLAMSAALGSTAALADTTTNAPSELDKDMSVPAPQRASMVGASFDYFNYDAKYGGGSTGLGAFSGDLQGDLLGGNLTMSFFNPQLFLDLGYRGGTLDGTLNLNGSIPLNASIEREDFDAALSYKTGSIFGHKEIGLILGLEYEYVNQDVSLTLPPGRIWLANNSRHIGYNEDMHLGYVNAGTQYHFALFDGDSLKLDLLPSMVVGIGLAYIPSDLFLSSYDAGLSWKAQGTLRLEARFGKDFGWRIFAEGGYKYVGIDTSDNSRDYYGPYARAGITYSF